MTGHVASFLMMIKSSLSQRLYLSPGFTFIDNATIMKPKRYLFNFKNNRFLSSTADMCFDTHEFEKLFVLNCRVDMQEVNNINIQFMTDDSA